jgi:hypothetical protein
MTDREAQLALITGWAIRGERWRVLEPDGTGATWTDATDEEIAALDAALDAYPRIAMIWRGLMDTALAHRADCATLRPNVCTCREPEHGGA